MVASSCRRIGKPGNPTNERCVTLAEALDTITSNPNLATPNLLAACWVDREFDKLGSERKTSVNIRVGERVMNLLWSGCIPEHEHVTAESYLSVVDCPTDTEKRCAKCILGLEAGPDIVASLTRDNFIIES